MQHWSALCCDGSESASPHRLKPRWARAAGTARVPGLALPGIGMLIPALKNFSPLPRSQDCFKEQGALPGSAALRASSELPAGWPSARSLRLWGELGTAPADGEARNPLIISPALCRCMKLDLAPLAERLLSSSLTPAETTLPLQS